MKTLGSYKISKAHQKLKGLEKTEMTDKQFLGQLKREFKKVEVVKLDKKLTGKGVIKTESLIRKTGQERKKVLEETDKWKRVRNTGNGNVIPRIV